MGPFIIQSAVIIIVGEPNTLCPLQKQCPLNIQLGVQDLVLTVRVFCRINVQEKIDAVLEKAGHRHHAKRQPGSFRHLAGDVCGTCNVLLRCKRRKCEMESERKIAGS